MPTASLRRDHDLIEVARAMEVTARLLEGGTRVPEQVLAQTIDFAKNFTDACHHSKEEQSLFPALERAGMPHDMGPIAVMLADHRRSREIAERMEVSARQYASTGDAAQLAADMGEYVAHIRDHLWKENNRLFVMAEARLQHVSGDVGAELGRVERDRLAGLGRQRPHYEGIAESLEGYAQSGGTSRDGSDEDPSAEA